MIYTVSKANEEDWEDAMALAYRTFQRFVGPGYSKEGVDNFVNFISDPHLYRMFQVEEYHLWVAKDEDGQVLGLGSLRSGNHISLLFVDENWQKCGVGRSIISAFEEYVKADGKDRITVNASPYGVPFYHRLGFADIDKEQISGGMTITPMRKLFT